MKVAVIGAGAMGSLFGGMLAATEHEVWLYSHWQEHIDIINKKGMTIVSVAGETIVHPQATTVREKIGTADLVIVFVKSPATYRAAKSALALLGPDSLVLTLQNGYGNAEILAEVVGRDRVIAGITAHGATMLGPGRILHAGSGETRIGELDRKTGERTRRIAALLTSAGFSTDVDQDVTSLIWGKLLINVGINALTAITGLRNGQLNDYAPTRELMRLAVAEAEQVARTADIMLPYPDSFAKVANVAQATADNKSSMLQDIESNRRTEIEAINGVIVKEGERLGVATPVNRVLTLLVQSLENYGG